MLVEFDEGQGTLVADDGPAGQVGVINGAFTWVPLCPDPTSCCAGGVATYCTAKTNSLNCTPAIGFSGLPMLSGADDFSITASNVLSHRPGGLVWSVAADSVLFAGGTLCVKPPVVRTHDQMSSGNTPSDCSGTFVYPWTNAYMAAHLIAPGTTIYAQYWYRDPGFAEPNGIGLTNALRFAVCP
jgi:hypothetical protein